MAKNKNNSAESAPQNDALKGAENQEAPKAAKPTWTQVKKIRNSDFKDVPKEGKILISGNILSFESDSGDYGDYTVFKGDFLAKFTLPARDAIAAVGDKPGFAARPEKEVTLRSTRLFLPPVAEEILNNHIAGFLATHDVSEIKKTGGLSFALRLVKTTDDSPDNARGWVWNVEPIGRAQSASDRVLALMEASEKEV